jgi:hypothetical protein
MSKCAVVWRISTADSNQTHSLAGTPQSVPKPIKLAVAGHLVTWCSYRVDPSTWHSGFAGGTIEA